MEFLFRLADDYSCVHHANSFDDSYGKEFKGFYLVVLVENINQKFKSPYPRTSINDALNRAL